MKRNVGQLDRMARVIGGVGMLASAVFVPLPLSVRLATFGVLGTYLLFSAAARTCFGYRLLGRSTCPMESA